MPLTDKVAVVTGATGTLGPAVARAFVQEGARLVLVSPHESALTALVNDLGYRESRVVKHPAEPTDVAAVQSLVDAVRTRFGRADILLHLAGGYKGGTLLETPDESWQYLWDANVKSAINTIRAFLPLLTANRWGRIVTLSSGVTQTPPSNNAAYVTAKAALEALTLAVAQEVKDQGVTANVVLVRSLDTPAERAKQPDKSSGWVRPEDVAATLLFLCTEAAGAITGARIPVFGGNA
jgi:NAD(P)-dependent dehydrogenase (short-subunit alcohol dehydrogenase family)